MNMQAMMQQAKKLQKDMMETQKKIDAMEFTGKSSIVTVTMSGKKELKAVVIDAESMDKEEIEMLQDMITVAVNDALKQIDKVIEEKMGVYAKGMPGLF